MDNTQVIPRKICTPISFDNLEVFCSTSELPATCVNDKGENVIISKEPYEDTYCFRLDTYQSNNWIRINRYYPNGGFDETYEK